MHAHAHEGLASVTDACRVLAKRGDSVDRSTLSRYVNKHGLVRGRRGRETLVNLEEVSAHRAANYTREVMGGAPLAPARTIEPVILLDPKRRQAQAQAEKAEIDLEERKGTLVPLAEVEAGLADSVSSWRQVMGDQSRQMASEIVAALGLGADRVREVRAILSRHHRQAEQVLRDRFAAIASRHRTDGAAARARLAHLSVVAHRQRQDAAQDATG